MYTSSWARQPVRVWIKHIYMELQATEHHKETRVLLKREKKQNLIHRSCDTVHKAFVNFSSKGADWRPTTTEHLVWWLVHTGCPVSVQYSECVKVSLSKYTKGGKKQRKIEKWHHCTSTLNKNWRRLSAESEGLKLNALNVVSLLASCQFLCLGVDNFNKLWLEGGSTHEETVNVLLGGEFFASSTGHRTWKGEQISEQSWRQEQKLKIQTRAWSLHRPP